MWLKRAVYFATVAATPRAGLPALQGPCRHRRTRRARRSRPLHSCTGRVSALGRGPVGQLLRRTSGRTPHRRGGPVGADPAERTVPGQAVRADEECVARYDHACIRRTGADRSRRQQALQDPLQQALSGRARLPSGNVLSPTSSASVCWSASPPRRTASRSRPWAGREWCAGIPKQQATAFSCRATAASRYSRARRCAPRRTSRWRRERPTGSTSPRPVASCGGTTVYPCRFRPASRGSTVACGGGRTCSFWLRRRFGGTGPTPGSSPFARVGPDPFEQYALPDTTNIITPRTSGRVLPLRERRHPSGLAPPYPHGLERLYGNNRGKATVTVTKVSAR